MKEPNGIIVTLLILLVASVIFHFVVLTKGPDWWGPSEEQVNSELIFEGKDAEIKELKISLREKTDRLRDFKKFTSIAWEISDREHDMRDKEAEENERRLRVFDIETNKIIIILRERIKVLISLLETKGIKIDI